jgi:hypothetical protein
MRKRSTLRSRLYIAVARDRQIDETPEEENAEKKTRRPQTTLLTIYVFRDANVKGKEENGHLNGYSSAEESRYRSVVPEERMREGSRQVSVARQLRPMGVGRRRGPAERHRSRHPNAFGVSVSSQDP